MWRAEAPQAAFTFHNSKNILALRADALTALLHQTRGPKRARISPFIPLAVVFLLYHHNGAASITAPHILGIAKTSFRHTHSATIDATLYPATQKQTKPQRKRIPCLCPGVSGVPSVSVLSVRSSVRAPLVLPFTLTYDTLPLETKENHVVACVLRAYR